MKICILDQYDKKSKALISWLRELETVEEIYLYEDEAMFIKQVEENPPDCCIISLDLNGISGFGIAEMIKKTNDVVKIVFISDKPDYAVDAYEVGAQGYLLVPIDKTKLLNCLKYR